MIAPAIDLCSFIEARAPTRLRPDVRTDGGVFVGACPFPDCSSDDDGFHVWPNSVRPRYWCRVCGRTGDAISFIRQYEGKSYHEALRELDIDTPATDSPPPTHMTVSRAPLKIWQGAGRGFCHVSHHLLWSKRGELALAYLRARGFTDAMIQEAGLGYWPGPKFKEFKGSEWGIKAPLLKIPRGITIPWYHAGDLWKITLRLGKEADHRYEQVLGSQECLYNVDKISSEKTTVLYEGVFDALSGQQLAPEFAHVATDDVKKCRSARWIVKLCLSLRVLVAYDADEAGDREAAFWTRTLSHAVRWRPWNKDVNAMLIEGQDILEWLVLGLA